jgi:hypothetical protein
MKKPQKLPPKPPELGGDRLKKLAALAKAKATREAKRPRSAWERINELREATACEFVAAQRAIETVALDRLANMLLDGEADGALVAACQLGLKLSGRLVEAQRITHEGSVPVVIAPPKDPAP